MAQLVARDVWDVEAAGSSPVTPIFTPPSFAMPTEETTILYRPVGQKERELIQESGYKAFPPRLPFQPIFYPVLNEEYATQIARDWNTKDAASGYAGYVTRFAVRSSFLSRYEVQTVGSSDHQEYWVPAKDLSEFNANIVGAIELIAEYYGNQHDH